MGWLVGKINGLYFLQSMSSQSPKYSVWQWLVYLCLKSESSHSSCKISAPALFSWRKSSAKGNGDRVSWAGGTVPRQAALAPGEVGGQAESSWLWCVLDAADHVYIYRTKSFLVAQLIKLLVISYQATWGELRTHSGLTHLKECQHCRARLIY